MRDGLKGQSPTPSPSPDQSERANYTLGHKPCVNQHWPPQNRSCLACYSNTVAPTSDPQMPTRCQVIWENGLCL